MSRRMEANPAGGMLFPMLLMIACRIQWIYSGMELENKLVVLEFNKKYGALVKRRGGFE